MAASNAVQTPTTNNFSQSLQSVQPFSLHSLGQPTHHQLDPNQFAATGRTSSPHSPLPLQARPRAGSTARLHIPIYALSDAADYLKHHIPHENHDGIHPGEAPPLDRRPAKRPRLSPPQLSTTPTPGSHNQLSTPDEPPSSPIATPRLSQAPLEAFSPSHLTVYDFNDVVSKGIVTEKDARALVALWLRQMCCFCSLLDPVVDTFESIRRRSPFLLAVVIHGAARAAKGRAPAPKMLIDVAEEVRHHAQTLVFEHPDIETAQAMIIMASWHDEPYILTGYAFRMAQSLEADLAAIELDELGWDSPGGRPLIVKLRTWIVAAFIELRHSRSSGRTGLLQEVDADLLERRIDRLFLSRFRIPSDVRLVANAKLALIERRTVEAGARLGDVDSQIKFLIEMREVLSNWHAHYDDLIAQDQPSPIAWSRAIHMRQLQDALIFLPCTLFSRDMFSPDASPQMQNLAREVWYGAAETMHSLLLSPTYTASVRYTPYLLKADLAFAGLISLKLANLYPEIATDEWMSDVATVADLLGACSGSPRFSLVLKLLRDQFIASRVVADNVTLLRPAALQRLHSDSPHSGPGPQITHPSSVPQSPVSLPAAVASPSLMPSPKWTNTAVPTLSNLNPSRPINHATLPSSFPGGGVPSASLVGMNGSGLSGAGELALLPGEVDDMGWFSGLDLTQAGAFAGNALGMGNLGKPGATGWGELGTKNLWGGNGTGGWGDPVMGAELEWMRGLIVDDDDVPKT